jgi:hypothetical protein
VSKVKRVPFRIRRSADVHELGVPVVDDERDLGLTGGIPVLGGVALRGDQRA